MSGKNGTKLPRGAVAAKVAGEAKVKPAVEPKARAAAKAKPEAKSKPEAKGSGKREAKAAGRHDENLVVFAIRLTEAERDAIHKAAGPGRATKLVRAVVNAAATGDEAAFKRAVREAADTREK